MSSGYREFKGPEDAYRNDVVSLIYIPLGALQNIDATLSKTREDVRMPHGAQNFLDTETTEIATFYISGEWFGIPSTNVVEATDAVGITPVPGMPDYVRGVVMFQGNPILVFDLKEHLRMNKPLDGNGYGQIVIVRSGDDCFGILVHRLGEIPSIANSRIDPIANLFPGENVLAESVVKPEPGDTRHQLLLILSTERIHQRLVKARERMPTQAAPLRALNPGSAVA
jgi:chemotaxis signal transduction protein